MSGQRPNCEELDRARRSVAFALDGLSEFLKYGAETTVKLGLISEDVKLTAERLSKELKVVYSDLLNMSC